MLVVANDCIYIHPIQKDLDLSPVEDMDEVIIQISSVLQGVAWVNHSERLQMLPTLLYLLIAGGY